MRKKILTMFFATVIFIGACFNVSAVDSDVAAALGHSAVANIEPAAFSQDNPANEVVSFSAINRTAPIIIPLGTAEYKLAEYFDCLLENAEIKTAGGDIYLCPIKLNLAEIDVDAPGIYLPVEIDLPDGLYWGSKVDIFELAVYVMPFDGIILDTTSIYSSDYIVQWLHTAANPVLWVRIDEGEWFKDNQGSYASFFENDPDLGTNGMVLDGDMIGDGHSYKFQVQYDGDRYSNILFFEYIMESRQIYTILGGRRDREGNNAATLSDIDEMILEGYTEITLTNSILIPAGEFLTLSSSEGNLTINSGEFGFIVEGELAIGHGVEIIGDGDKAPIISVENGGTFSVDYASYEFASVISALNSGATAIWLDEGSSFAQNSHSAIIINAKNGTAIYSEISLELETCEINAKVGVNCSENVNIFLSRINASDISLLSPSFTVDTCVLAPAPVGDGKYIQRRITQLSPTASVLNIGESVPEFNTGFAFLSAENEDDIALEVDFEIDSSLVNTKLVGDYKVPIMLPEWLRTFGINSPEDKFYTFYVRDLRIPYYYSYSSEFGQYYLYYYYGDNIDNIIVWRSDDDGATWYDATAKTQIADDITITFSKPENHPILLVLEVVGIGQSDILRVTWNGYNIGVSELDGDRTGIGRGENEPPPVGVVPPSTECRSPSFGDGSRGSSVQDSDRNSQSAGSKTVAPDTTVKGSSKAIEATVPAPDDSPTLAHHPAVSAANTVNLSSEELALMMAANPDTVSFFRDDLRVSLPTGFLESLNISPSDSISLVLDMPDNDGFSIYLNINDSNTYYSFSPPFYVSLLWTGGELYCTAEDGTKIAAELKDGRANFTLTSFGAYSLTGNQADIEALVPVTSNQNLEPPADNPPPVMAAKDSISDFNADYNDSGSPVIIVIITGVVGTCLVLLLLRRRVFKF